MPNFLFDEGQNRIEGYSKEETMQAIREAVGDLFYPVGSIYLSVTDNTAEKVAQKFGGTWEAFGAGCAIVGYNSSDSDFNRAEKTGGVKSVTLTAAQSGVPAHTHTIPAHNHTFTRPTVQSSGAITNGITGGGHTHTAGLSSAPYSKPYQQFGATTVSGGSGYTVPCMAGDRAWGGITDTTTHTHNLPNHTHTLTGGGISEKPAFNTNKNSETSAASAHTNLQPYITVFMYKRTA